MIRRPPRSTLSSSSAASDVYKRQDVGLGCEPKCRGHDVERFWTGAGDSHDRVGSRTQCRYFSQDRLFVATARVEPEEEAIAALIDVVHPGLHKSGPVAAGACRACLVADECDVLILQFDLVCSVGGIKVDAGAFGEISSFGDGITARRRQRNADARNQRRKKTHVPPPVLHWLLTITGGSATMHN